MYKIADKVIKFIKETIESGIDIGREKFCYGENPEKYIPVRCANTVTILIAVVPLNPIFKKCIGSYKYIKSQEKINHLMYMDDIKQFDKNEKELVTLVQAVRNTVRI